MINIGIIGYGYWGPNLVRNFVGAKGCRLKRVADLRANRLEIINKQYPSVETTTNPDDVLSAKDIDAVVIATPVFLHHEQAKKALNNGKHILVEKPVASSSAQAKELIDLASAKNKILMVDHTFLYTGAVKKIKEIIDSGKIGQLQYFDSIRINLGLFQPDINVLWDLAPHDISILNHICGFKPYSVNAQGASHTKNKIENVAYLTVNYQENFIGHFSCSWTSPVKIRHTLIGGSEKMILYDDVEPTEKVRIYETTYKHTPSTDEEKKNIYVDYRQGDIHIPKIINTEALAEMAADFIRSIQNNTPPMVTGAHGLEVVRILEAANQSLKYNGKEIVL